MGIDAVIYFKVREGETLESIAEWRMPQHCRVIPASDWAIEGATHEVDVPYRYYGEGYERGPWPLICSVLLEVMAAPEVEIVWYSGDSGSEMTDQPFTKSRLMEIVEHYLEHGNRAYKMRF